MESKAVVLFYATKCDLYTISVGKNILGITPQLQVLGFVMFNCGEYGTSCCVTMPSEKWGFG